LNRNLRRGDDLGAPPRDRALALTGCRRNIIAIGCREAARTAVVAPEAWRVQLARRVHNDVVVSTRDLRRRRLVQWLRLAGRAPMPSTIELEDGR
jgi:hypothetical protein